MTNLQKQGPSCLVPAELAPEKRDSPLHPNTADLQGMGDLSQNLYLPLEWNKPLSQLLKL